MLNLLLSLSLSHTGHWKFNMAPHAGVILGFFNGVAQGGHGKSHVPQHKWYDITSVCV